MNNSKPIAVLPIHQVLGKKRKKILVGLNWYRNCHFIENDTVKKIYLNLIAEQTRKMQTIQSPPHFHYKIYVANKRTDGGNVRSIIEKFFLDALVENKILENDTIDFISKDSSEYFIDKNNPRAEIYLL